jgi:hypothetical protein
MGQGGQVLGREAGRMTGPRHYPGRFGRLHLGSQRVLIKPRHFGADATQTAELRPASRSASGTISCGLWARVVIAPPQTPGEMC